MHTGVMHLSNDVSATDVDNFPRSSDSLSTDVKCELKMEVDDKNLWSDVGQERQRSNSTLHPPGDSGLRGIRRADVHPSLRSIASSGIQTGREQAGEPMYPVSRLTSFVGSFPSDPQHPCHKQAGNEFPNPATSHQFRTSSDKTFPESYHVSRLEASRSYRKESQNTDGVQNQLGSQCSDNVVEVGQKSGGISIVGHQTCSRERFDELILSTPFGTFHRAPLSFWPTKGTAEQSTSSSHYPGSADSATRDVCARENPSRDKRGSPLSSQNETALGCEHETPRKVSVRFHHHHHHHHHHIRLL